MSVVFHTDLESEFMFAIVEKAAKVVQWPKLSKPNQLWATNEAEE